MNAPDFSSLGLFGTGLGQHARLITLASAQDSTVLDALVAERFTGREAVNELFCFEIDALSTSTDLDLSLFPGEELSVGLLQPDGGRRYWHGLCTGAAWLGADGGVARYRLRLEPALALLALRRDSYIFQDKNVREIVTELLADYPQVVFDFDIGQELPRRPICTQYRESDFDFFVRLLAAEGLSWRFDHEERAAGRAQHRLVVFDSRASLPAVDPIRFHGVRATEKDDTIDAFRARRTVAANGVSISSWNPAHLFAPGAEQQSQLDAGDLPPLPSKSGGARPTPAAP